MKPRKGLYQEDSRREAAPAIVENDRALNVADTTTQIQLPMFGASGNQCLVIVILTDCMAVGSSVRSTVWDRRR
jgi:hypothetical protein